MTIKWNREEILFDTLYEADTGQIQLQMKYMEEFITDMIHQITK